MQASGFQLNALDPRSVGDLQRLARENPDSPETLRAVSKQFEAMFLQMALKAMRDATPKDSMFDSEQTRTYQSLLDQQLALQMAHTRNNGLSETLFRQLGGLNASASLPPGSQAAAAAQPNATASSMPTANPAAASSLLAPSASPLVSLSAPAAAIAAQQLRANGMTKSGVNPTEALKSARLSFAEASANGSDDPVGALINHIETATAVTSAGEGKAWQHLTGVIVNGMRSGLPATATSAAAGTANAAALSGRSVTGKDGDWTAEDRQAFVRELWPHAQAVSAETGIPARFIIAQAALETGWGEKVLRHADGRSSYNLFNIKAGRQWQGDTVTRTVTEYTRQQTAYKERAEFRSYDSPAEAVRDYARLLMANPRYERVLGQTDAVSFARSLQQAGYATDPRYADKLTRVIRGQTLNSALSA